MLMRNEIALLITLAPCKMHAVVMLSAGCLADVRLVCLQQGPIVECKPKMGLKHNIYSLQQSTYIEDPL